MTDQICGAQQEGTDRTCTKPMPCTYYHQADDEEIWPGIVPEPRKSRKAEIDKMARGINQQKPVGPPDPGEVDWDTGKPKVKEEVPFDEDSDDWKVQWVAYAVDVFEGFLARVEREFTTAEDVWPLLVNPPNRRAMRDVVAEALERGWIIEGVVQRRLRDTYRTKDGVEFQMNKYVPTYRSLIGSRPVVDLSEID